MEALHSDRFKKRYTEMGISSTLRASGYLYGPDALVAEAVDRHNGVLLCRGAHDSELGDRIGMWISLKSMGSSIVMFPTQADVESFTADPKVVNAISKKVERVSSRINGQDWKEFSFTPSS